ncbi:hypothetical protein niasHT_031537 [Heterodera trifolii]|uniref:Uncharacterized protein n=1 Tax=Heterodera trifolii TaxID=157864 RepID=A0ABD2HPJ9_9BILA
MLLTIFGLVYIIIISETLLFSSVEAHRFQMTAYCKESEPGQTPLPINENAFEFLITCLNENAMIIRGENKITPYKITEAHYIPKITAYCNAGLSSVRKLPEPINAKAKEMYNVCLGSNYEIREIDEENKRLAELKNSEMGGTSEMNAEMGNAEMGGTSEMNAEMGNAEMGRVSGMNAKMGETSSMDAEMGKASGMDAEMGEASGMNAEIGGMPKWEGQAKRTRMEEKRKRSRKPKGRMQKLEGMRREKRK